MLKKKFICMLMKTAKFFEYTFVEKTNTFEWTCFKKITCRRKKQNSKAKVNISQVSDIEITKKKYSTEIIVFFFHFNEKCSWNFRTKNEIKFIPTKEKIAMWVFLRVDNTSTCIGIKNQKFSNFITLPFFYIWVIQWFWFCLLVQFSSIGDYYLVLT